MSYTDNVANEVGELEPQPARAKAGNGANGHSSARKFDLVNAVSTIAVLSALGVEHDEKHHKCIGCGEDGALICKDGGSKCLHNRCAGVGPAAFPGFRSNVDLVAESERIEPDAAVQWLAERFNIELPSRKAQQNDDWQHATPSDDDAPNAPPKPDNCKDEFREKQKAKQAAKKPRTVADIVEDWRTEGQTERVDLGIPTLDEKCGGGLPIPRRVLITGAPSAGKTYELVWIAEQFLTRLAAFGFMVGIVAIDEDDTDLLVRFAQMRGFTPAQLEERTAETLAQVAAEFANTPVRFYDSEWSLDAAAEDLAAAAKAKGCPSALFVDSIHVAWSAAGIEARSIRESIDCNFKVLKRAHLVHRMTVITTGEMNRQNYASEKQAADANIAASTAETRAAEFWAQTHLAVRTPKDFEGIVECTIAKNRGIRSKKGKFWLRLQHESHDIQEVGDPNENPEFVQAKENKKRTAAAFKNTADANQLGKFILTHPGLNVRGLRTAISAEPSMGWGHSKLDKALAVLRTGQTIYTITEPKKDGPAVYSIALDPGDHDA